MSIKNATDVLLFARVEPSIDMLESMIPTIIEDLNNHFDATRSMIFWTMGAAWYSL